MELKKPARRVMDEEGTREVEGTCEEMGVRWMRLGVEVRLSMVCGGIRSETEIQSLVDSVKKKSLEKRNLPELRRRDGHQNPQNRASLPLLASLPVT